MLHFTISRATNDSLSDLVSNVDRFKIVHTRITLRNYSASFEYSPEPNNPMKLIFESKHAITRYFQWPNLVEEGYWMRESNAYAENGEHETLSLNIIFVS